MKFYLCVLFCFAWQGVAAQHFPLSQKSLDFQERYKAFRYSLYTALEGINIESHRDLEQVMDSLDKQIKEKISTFLHKHRTDIQTYQTDILRFYAHITVDLSLFEVDTVLSFATEELGIFPVSIIQLNKVDPIEMLYTYWNMTISRIYPVSKMASQVYKNIIAKPLIITKEVAQGHWQLFYDNYETVARLDYQVKTRTVSQITLYKRKR
jgi:hypothetical protein